MIGHAGNRGVRGAIEGYGLLGVKLNAAWRMIQFPTMMPIGSSPRWLAGLFLAGCLTPLAAADSQKLNGEWVGSTSQGKPISFTVAGDVMSRLGLEWKLPLPEPCHTRPGSPVAPVELGGQSEFFFYPNSPGNTPPKITAAGWKLERETRGEAPVQLSISATLKSPEFSGVITLTAKSCKGSAKVTWVAKKK